MPLRLMPGALARSVYRRDRVNQTEHTLEGRFITFLEKLEYSENLDDSSFDAELVHGKRADFLLDQRRIILEVKSLEADPEHKIEERLSPHRMRPEFPVFYWKADLNEILPYLPDGEDIRRDIFHAVTRAVQGALEKADDQIEATKNALGIPDACGAVAILNENIGILAPELVTAKASQMLLKTRDGDIRYRHIAYVWIISEGHRLVHNSSTEHLPMILLEGPTGSSNVTARDYLDGLQPKWAKFLGVPFSSLGEHVNFDGLNFETRSVEPPSSTDDTHLTRQEAWRRAYQKNPYLRSLSEVDFLRHTARIFETMTPHFLKGGRKLTESAIADLMEGWTHALEEAQHRHLDMRKLQGQLPDLDTLRGGSDRS